MLWIEQSGYDIFKRVVDQYEKVFNDKVVYKYTFNKESIADFQYVSSEIKKALHKVLSSKLIPLLSKKEAFAQTIPNITKTSSFPARCIKRYQLQNMVCTHYLSRHVDPEVSAVITQAMNLIDSQFTGQQYNHNFYEQLSQFVNQETKEKFFVSVGKGNDIQNNLGKDIQIKPQSSIDDNPQEKHSQSTAHKNLADSDSIISNVAKKIVSFFGGYFFNIKFDR